jgi:hypothetical protein
VRRHIHTNVAGQHYNSVLFTGAARACSPCLPSGPRFDRRTRVLAGPERISSRHNNVFATFIAVSPFSNPAYVSHAIGDHTSIVALIERRFLTINGVSWCRLCSRNCRNTLHRLRSRDRHREPTVAFGEGEEIVMGTGTTFTVTPFYRLRRTPARLPNEPS